VNVSDLLAQLLEEATTLAKSQFTARYPHSFLLCETNTVVPTAPTRLELISPATAVAAPTFKKPAAAQPSREVIIGRPNGFAALAIVKSDRNPWADRILVGRAKNNDIVLFNQSVSKVHACFTKNGARHQLSAYQTLNPTMLGGLALMPNAPAVDLSDGADIQFGTVSCRYFEPASFYRLLAGRF
jgi:hypothetical protein